MRIKFTPVRLAMTVLSFLFFSFIISCNKYPIAPADKPYDLDVVLNSLSKHDKGSGFVKFRQDPDTARIISLDTWVYDLEPHRAYQLQRAANPTTDSTCNSTAWLTLGNSLIAESIHTDGMGNGFAALSRNVTSIARGSSYHIHFQVIDSITQSVVLTSDCYMYTVR